MTQFLIQTQEKTIGIPSTKLPRINNFRKFFSFPMVDHNHLMGQITQNYLLKKLIL